MSDKFLREAAGRLLGGGTLVFEPGNPVAYAFVIPVDLRDDLADALADIAIAEDP